MDDRTPRASTHGGERRGRSTSKRTERTAARARAGGGGSDTRGAAEQRRSDRRQRRGAEPVHLPDDLAAELHATARPGKGSILVKVFSEAAGAFAEEDWATAIRLLGQSKHIALRSPAVRELLGLALYRSGRYKDAARELAAFRRLSGSQEQNPVLADCYRAMAKPERALELCDEIDARRVDAAVFYEGQIVAAGALRDMGRVEDAIARLESLDLDPPAAQEHHLRALYALADLLEASGRFTQARKLFDAVAANDPELTDAAERVRRLAGRRR